MQETRQRAAVLYRDLAVGKRSVVTSGLYPRGPFKSRLAERETTLAKAEHATLEQAYAWADSVLGLDEGAGEPARDTERAPALDGIRRADALLASMAEDGLVERVP